MTDPRKELIRTAMSLTGWDEEDTRNFLSCLVADTPDALMEEASDALEFARRIEMQAAAIDIMKQVGGRALSAQMTPTRDDIALRFRPDISIELTETADETMMRVKP